MKLCVWLLQICYCSGWWLEESRIHDPDAETATVRVSVIIKCTYINRGVHMVRVREND